MNNVGKSIQEILSQVRILANRKEPFSDNFMTVQRELRERRKLFLGSHISLRDIIWTDYMVDDLKVQALSQYLSKRTLHYWNVKGPKMEKFALHFYELSIHALCDGKVVGESIDDILQLAECLVQSKSVYIDAMKHMLCDNMISTLFEFTDSFDTVPSYFESAVLASICVCLGVLTDPIIDSEAAAAPTEE